jgi:MarR family transcriptional regulator, organic hydroperoxide resistance regulator
MQASVSSTQANRAAELTADLAALFKHLLGTTTSEFMATIEKLDLSFTQVKTLGVLDEAEAPLSVKALSDRLGLSLPAVSRGVEALVQRGEVKRDEDPSDRRAKLVALTARGHRTYDGLVALKVAGVRRFVEELDPVERDALAEALRPVVERTAR